jgi:uncharacterized protein (TIGR03437 family)
VAFQPSVTFEENRGQTASQARFLSRAAGQLFFFTNDSVFIRNPRGGALRVRLEGIRPVKLVGLNRVPGESNYLTGADRTQWHTGIPNYQGLRYPGVYPGIDLIWHGQAGEMEHDFVITPGADPRRIRLGIRGAQLKLGVNGDLIASDLILRKPRAYQNGREIPCQYVLRGQSVRFALGKYDQAQSLTIDPVLNFSTFLGSGSYGRAVGRDSAGNVYIAGTTASLDFPTTSTAFQRTSGCEALNVHECEDAFVSKFTSDGALLFSTYLGLKGDSHPSLGGMAVDQSGIVYLTGFGAPPQVQPLLGYTSLQNSGTYIVKLSADGTKLLYSSELPSSTPGYAPIILAIAVDAAGSVYLTGSVERGLPIVNALQPTRVEAAIFKSTNSAATWQGLMDDLPAARAERVIAVDPTNPQTLYLGTDQGVYKSTDAGTHWAVVLQSPPAGVPYPGRTVLATTIAVDPLRPQTVYVGDFLIGVLKSTDGGATWAASGAGANPQVSQIIIGPANPQTLYAATFAGLYKSTDGAATWSLTGLSPSPGETDFLHAVVVDPQATSTLYAATVHGVMKSADGGASWTALTNGFTQNAYVTDLVIDPVNSQMLYAFALELASVAPYRTSDGGAHWTQGRWPPGFGSFGETQPFLVRRFLVDPRVHTTVWAATSEGILVSRDSGATWNLPAAPLPEDNTIALAADSGGTLYALQYGIIHVNAFAMKLDPTGSIILYSTYLGGFGSDSGRGISVDSQGRAYILGQTDSVNFPVNNALQPRLAGGKDAFISVLDPNGTQLLWSTYLGGSNDDSASAIALDPGGNIHVAGSTFLSDLPLQHPTQQRLGGLSDGFVAKLKGDGSAVLYSTYLGGSGMDFANAVAADASGNTYVAGQTYSKDLGALNAIQPSLAGQANAFAGAWNGQSGALNYLTYLGGSSYDAGTAIAADPSGGAYIAGYTDSSDFPIKYPFQAASGSLFLAKIANVGPAIGLAAVTGAAGYAAVVAPGEIASLFGTAFAAIPATALEHSLPTQLSGVSVTVNGVPAPLFYAAPFQVNFQIPFETAPGAAQIQVTSGAGTAMLSVPVAQAAPGIFTLNASGSGAGAIEHGVTGQLVSSANPAAAGEIVSIYCTGLGAVSPAAASGTAPPAPPPQTVLPVQVSVASIPAQVTFAGLAPGFVGLYQVNAMVPPGAPSGVQNVQIFENGAISNTVTISIQ